MLLFHIILTNFSYPIRNKWMKWPGVNSPRVSSITQKSQNIPLFFSFFRVIMDMNLDLPNPCLKICFGPPLSDNYKKHINNDSQRVFSISNQFSVGEKTSYGKSAKPSRFQASILKWLWLRGSGGQKQDVEKANKLLQITVMSKQSAKAKTNSSPCYQKPLAGS